MTLQADLMVLLPELTLAVGAMALLLVGVFGGDRLTGLVSWLAIALLAAAGVIVFTHAGKATAFHGAFVVESRAAVRAFYDAALRAGGRDNGAPGLRPQYHPNYYGAFVFDLDGHNVEAVCHEAFLG